MYVGVSHCLLQNTPRELWTHHILPNAFPIALSTKSEYTDSRTVFVTSKSEKEWKQFVRAMGLCRLWRSCFTYYAQRHADSFSCVLMCGARVWVFAVSCLYAQWDCVGFGEVVLICYARRYACMRGIQLCSCAVCLCVCFYALRVLVYVYGCAYEGYWLCVCAFVVHVCM